MSTPEQRIADSAGLRYVSDDRPGIRRVRSGRGFRYLGPDGRPVEARVRDRARALVIPPAWTDVWIAPIANAHLQATGRDAKGRKQYLYHPRWREVRDRHKFDRMWEFGEALPGLRRQVDEDLTLPGLPRARVLALVIALLDRTLIRIGNEVYLEENGSHGLTTLQCEHVAVRGRSARFEFVGKGGIEHGVTVADGRMARIIRRCHELGGQYLFSYADDEGGETAITSAEVNDHLRALTGLDVSAKDFRTWGATALVAEHLAAAGPPVDRQERLEERRVLEAIDAAAERLRNTRAVARTSYVHPRIPEAHLDGTLHEHWAATRSGHGLSRAERTVLHLVRPESAPVDAARPDRRAG